MREARRNLKRKRKHKPKPKQAKAGTTHEPARKRKLVGTRTKPTAFVMDEDD